MERAENSTVLKGVVFPKCKIERVGASQSIDMVLRSDASLCAFAKVLAIRGQMLVMPLPP